MDPANRERLTSQAVQGIWIVLLSHPASDVGCEISREGGTSVGQNSGCETSGEGGMLTDRIPDVRHLEKVVECRPDRIPDVRHPAKAGTVNK